MPNHALQRIGIAVGLLTIWLMSCMPSTPLPDVSGRAGFTRIAIPEMIKHVFDPSLSPINSKVAFVSQTSETKMNIYVLDPLSGIVTPVLPSDLYYPVSHPKWSPDGASISFSGFSYQQPDTGIWILHSDSMTESVAPGIGATWSPDGSSLAVIGPTHDKYEIRIVNLVTKKLESIYAVQASSLRLLSDVDWSPDGSALAFIMVEKKDDRYEEHLYRIDVDGGNLQALVGVPEGQFVAGPKWVLGGKWIAFLIGPELDQRLEFVRSDGQCTVSPLADLHNIIAMDMSRDGATAVIRVADRLYKLDMKAVLAPQSLESALICQ